MNNSKYNLAGFTEYQVKSLAKATLEEVRKTIATPEGREKLEKKKAELKERGILK